MNPNQNSEYEFIIGEDHSKQPQLPNDPVKSSTKKKIMVGALIGGVLIIAGLTISAIISANGDKTPKNLVAIARQQGELVRIAELGMKKSKNAEVKALAITTQTTIKSDSGSMFAYLKSNSLPASPKDVGKSTNATKNDQTLTKAEQANQFDEAFKEVLKVELARYQKLLQQTYDSTTNPNTKKLIEQFFRNTELLSSNNATENNQ